MMRIPQIFLALSTISLTLSMVLGIKGLVASVIFITIGIIIQNRETENKTKVFQEATDKRNNSHTDEL